MIRLKIKQGQVWIETVLYTLIGLALIALVLAFVIPKVTVQKDKLAVDQAITALNDFDERINDVLKAPGNVRTISLNVKRGTFLVNGTGDYLSFYIADLSTPYSQANVPVQVGRVTVLSKKLQKGASVLLTINYAEDITYDKKDEFHKFAEAAIPYKFLIENLGVLNAVTGKNVITITEAS
jgi:hypothetical protein